MTGAWPSIRPGKEATIVLIGNTAANIQGPPVPVLDTMGAAPAMTPHLAHRHVVTKRSCGSDTSIELTYTLASPGAPHAHGRRPETARQHTGNILTGNAAANVLTGGLAKTRSPVCGHDTFDFNGLAETGFASTPASLTYIVRGKEKIDLSTLDASAATTASNEAFSFSAAQLQHHHATGRCAKSTIGDPLPGCYTGARMRAACRVRDHAHRRDSLATTDFVL